MRLLFLDIDGVMNRTGFRPAVADGLRSWIEAELAARLNDTLRITGAQLVLSSDWRIGRDVALLRTELAAAGVDGTLVGVTPVITGAERWREIRSYLQAHALPPETVAIVDDMFDMGPLAARFVRASPLNGLDEPTARALVELLGSDARAVLREAGAA